MATVYQPTRKDEFRIHPGADVFIRCDNGGSVRISVHKDSINILPINGVAMRLCVVNGSAGVEFTAPTR
jgi:hypothetical protein